MGFVIIELFDFLIAEGAGNFNLTKKKPSKKYG